MELSIVFNSSYKGKIKDKLSVKLSTLFLFLFLGFIFVFVGFYLYFVEINRIITRLDRFYGFCLIFLGLILILISPFSIIFKHMNKDLKGDISIFLYQEATSNKWMYRISAIKKNTPFLEIGEINTIVIKKNLAIIKSLRGEEYIIPLKELNMSQKETLFSIEKEVKQERIRHTSK